MALLNKNQNTNGQYTQRQMLESTVKNTRHNILLVLVFTIINIILRLAAANRYFLFSAYVPHFLVDLGMYYGGMYPTEYYGEYLSEVIFLGKGFFAVMLGIALIALILYALCWIFAKKHPKGWLIFALVLFSIDTAMMLLMAGISADYIVDYLFHGWVIVSLAKGLSAIKKLKELPEEVEEIVDAAPVEEAPAEETPEEETPVAELPEAAPAEAPETVTVEE